MFLSHKDLKERWAIQSTWCISSYSIGKGLWHKFWAFLVWMLKALKPQLPTWLLLLWVFSHHTHPTRVSPCECFSFIISWASSWSTWRKVRPQTSYCGQQHLKAKPPLCSTPAATLIISAEKRVGWRYDSAPTIQSSTSGLAGSMVNSPCTAGAGCPCPQAVG